ncbi:reverse transcriptase domain-containing protein [Tanacetum coccineum]
MTTPVEKRNQAKFCKLHGEVGHNTDECMHLRKQIEEMLKAGKLSHLIKDLKQNNGKEQPKVTKKRETSDKDKALTILKEDEGTEGPMIIEAEIGGHCIHRMYVDGGSALEILYEHCFSRFCPKIKNKLIPATTPLIGFSGEVIWPIGQIQVLVKIKDKEHSASAWMNFVVIRSPSLYNMIIGRLWVRKLQAVPSTAHGMLKISVEGGVITLKSSKLVPLECAVVSGPDETPSATKKAATVCVDYSSELGHFYLGSLGYDWHPKAHCGTSPNVMEGCFSGSQKKRRATKLTKPGNTKKKLENSCRRQNMKDVTLT